MAVLSACRCLLGPLIDLIHEVWKLLMVPRVRVFFLIVCDLDCDLFAGIEWHIGRPRGCIPAVGLPGMHCLGAPESRKRCKDIEVVHELSSAGVSTVSAVDSLGEVLVQPCPVQRGIYCMSRGRTAPSFLLYAAGC